jgi:2,4-dienoyl-CoA reductase (NADPH2)
MRYPHLFEPIRVGSLELRNRIAMGSMHTRLECEPDGARKLGAFYAERARGGASLIITGGVAPNPDGVMEADSDYMDAGRVAFHRVVTDAVHAAGTPILMQILHAGRYAKIETPVGASTAASRINRRKVRALTDAEVDRTVDDFAQAAVLAREAGYDGVEIMGSEGYLITQFTSPLTNDRTDRWGGPLENRLRFPLEIVRRMRAKVGRDFVIAFRLSALDLVEGGLTREETIVQARLLADAGVDALDTGIGWHEARVPTIAYVVPRAAWSFAVKAIRAAVSIPVMATNRINTPEIAEQLLADGIADMVSLGRPMLADADFANKARDGRPDEINTCIACNQACLDYLFADRAATCLVNPRACRETELPTGPAATPKRVAVVGAGAAGLSCAVTAFERGHRVTLFEAAPEIGGQLNLAKVIPGKEFAETLRYFRTRLDASSIDVRLGQRADADALASGAFDEVVLATGVRPRVPELEGVAHPKVLRYDDVLAGRVQVGPRVAIIGAGGIGFDVAAFLSAPHAEVSTDEFLDEWGVDRTGTTAGGLAPAKPTPPARRITILQRRPAPAGRTLGATTGWALRAELQRRGVAIETGVHYRCVDDRGLHYRVGEEEKCLEVDHVVLCAGQEAVNELAGALDARGLKAHVIGGADKAEELDALRAFDQGMRVALAF